MQILLALLGAVLLLFCVMAARTLTLRRRPALPGENYDPGTVPQEVLDRFSGALQIPTISRMNHDEFDFAQFQAFLEYLRSSYPKVFQKMDAYIINDYALVLYWKGLNSDLRPILMMGHYDVVPVETGTENDWRYPPFSGIVAEGMVWGRGSLDMKCQVIALLEAANNLIGSGFTPQRDIYYAFGQDEEVGGNGGAGAYTDWFEERGIRFEAVFDEGGVVMTGDMLGINTPLALMGICEKGFANLRLIASDKGGHSSTPPRHNALGKLCALAARIEDKPMPAKITPPVERMLNALAPELPFAAQLALANQWLLRPVVLRMLSKSPMTNALIRTTITPTMATASDAANVLPQQAEIIVNSRILPGETPDDVIAHIQGLYHGDDLVIQPEQINLPSPVSPVNTVGYEKLCELAREFYPSALQVPYLIMGGTDSKRLYRLCDNVYRFMPILITPEDEKRMHNTNECISVENYGRMIAFFERFLRGFDV